VFTRISLFFTLLISTITLPNGLRVVELPSLDETFEITAGYTRGGLTGLLSTGPAKLLLRDAYASGAKLESLNDGDRTAVRITAPQWAIPVVASELPGLFQQIPADGESAAGEPADFRARVEEEIRKALVPQRPIGSEYATDQAFVLISESLPSSLREALSAIPKRTASRNTRDDVPGTLTAERSLRFNKSDLPEGAVIFASPVPGVYYKQWYLVLLLDRLIQRTVPLPLKTSLPLAVRPNYYRIELSLGEGQFPEAFEEKLLQEIQRLQFTAPKASDLEAARDEAVGYLGSKAVWEWFSSLDIADRLDEGLQWVQSVTADEVRVAVRDILVTNRVVATWPPTTARTSVSAEPLTAAPASKTSVSRPESARLEGPITVFPSHSDDGVAAPLSERLTSGVSLVRSNIRGVFVSGGQLTRFEHEPTTVDLKRFQQFPAERILVLSPLSSMDRARQLWTPFKGAVGPIGVPQRSMSSADLAAVLILKTILELKLIEDGGWTKAEISIAASGDSPLQIRADDARRAQILEWINAIAAGSISVNYFSWVREVAFHRIEFSLPEIQAITWERDPQAAIPDPILSTRDQLQAVARRFQ
jgi:hypothetical protein